MECFLKKTDLIIDTKEFKNIYIAESFFERLKGLMFISKEKSFSLLIKNCNSVHTCFMKFNIDIYCLDKNYKTIKIYKNTKPFKFILPIKQVKHILEIPIKN